MAELLCRVVDKIGSNSYLDSKCTKRGDIIVVQENGWAWGSEELSNPHWRIVQAPNISVSAATAFLGPELPVDPLNPSLVLQRRGFKLDIALLPAAWAAWVADNSRAQPTKLFSGTAAQVLALKVQKAALVDPNIVG